MPSSTGVLLRGLLRDRLRSRPLGFLLFICFVIFVICVVSAATCLLSVSICSSHLLLLVIGWTAVAITNDLSVISCIRSACSATLPACPLFVLPVLLASVVVIALIDGELATEGATCSVHEIFYLEKVRLLLAKRKPDWQKAR